MAAGLGAQNRYVQWGAGLADLDNDGWPDLFYATGNVYPEIEALLPQYPHRGPEGRLPQPRRAAASRTCPPAAARARPTPHSSRGVAFGDFDNDGDVDVLVMNMNEPPSLLRNDYDGGNGWLELRLEGRTLEPGRHRRDGDRHRGRPPAGAQAVLSQSSYYSHDDLRLHFGLGAATRRRARRGALAERRHVGARAREGGTDRSW